MKMEIQISLQNKKEAIKREINFRKKVYPKQILQGKMTQAQADREIAIFENILKDYNKIKDPEELI